MFEHLLESSHRDDSNKWSNIGFGQEITFYIYIKIFMWKFTVRICPSFSQGHYLGRIMYTKVGSYVNQPANQRRQLGSGASIIQSVAD